jgi:hypothetical protein
MAEQMKGRHAVNIQQSQPKIAPQGKNLYVRFPGYQGVSSDAKNLINALGAGGKALSAYEKRRKEVDTEQGFIDQQAGVRDPDGSDEYVESYEYAEGEAYTHVLREKLMGLYNESRDDPYSEFHAKKEKLVNEIMQGKSKGFIKGLSKHGAKLEDDFSKKYFEYNDVKLKNNTIQNMNLAAEEFFRSLDTADPVALRSDLNERRQRLMKMGIDGKIISANYLETIGARAVADGRPEYLDFVKEPDDSGVRMIDNAELRKRYTTLVNRAETKGDGKKVTTALDDLQQHGLGKALSMVMTKAFRERHGLDAKQADATRDILEQNYRIKMNLKKTELAEKLETEEDHAAELAEEDPTLMTEYILGSSDIPQRHKRPMIKRLMNNIKDPNGTSGPSADYMKARDMVKNHQVNDFDDILNIEGELTKPEVKHLVWMVKNRDQKYTTMMNSGSKTIEDIMSKKTMLEDDTTVMKYAIKKTIWEWEQHAKELIEDGRGDELKDILKDVEKSIIGQTIQSNLPSQEEVIQSSIDDKLGNSLDDPTLTEPEGKTERRWWGSLRGWVDKMKKDSGGTTSTLAGHADFYKWMEVMSDKSGIDSDFAGIQALLKNKREDYWKLYMEDIENGQWDGETYQDGGALPGAGTTGGR